MLFRSAFDLQFLELNICMIAIYDDMITNFSVMLPEHATPEEYNKYIIFYFDQHATIYFQILPTLPYIL